MPDKPKGINKRKPTEKQLEVIKRMHSAKSLQEAMQQAGYSRATSENPKQNFMERAGVQTALREYRDLLFNAGAFPEVLAEIEAAGLFEENGAIRLGFLKEVKKSLGLAVPDKHIVGHIFSKEDYGY